MCVYLLISILFVSLMAFSVFIHSVHPRGEKRTIIFTVHNVEWRHKGAHQIPEVLGAIGNFWLPIHALCRCLSASPPE